MRTLMGVAALATVLSAAACGGSSAANAGKTPASPGGRTGQGGDRTAFNECLKQQGVTPPTGGAFGGGTGRPSGPPPSGRPQGERPSMSPELQKAFQACGSKLPQGGGGVRGRGFDASALQAFRACMKTNGADVPAQGGVRDLKTGDPKVAKALQKCRPLLPTPTPTASGTP